MIQREKIIEKDEFDFAWQKRGKDFEHFFFAFSIFLGAYRGKNRFCLDRYLDKVVREILIGQTLL